MARNLPSLLLQNVFSVTGRIVLITGGGMSSIQTRHYFVPSLS
jgi:hypothetical protein